MVLVLRDLPVLSFSMKVPVGHSSHLLVSVGPSGELFAQAPIDQYPGIAVETVTDSSRYFVIRIQDGTGEYKRGVVRSML